MKSIRKTLRLSQSELAARLGVTRETISNWERNGAPPIARLALATIARTESSIAKQRAEEAGGI